jgi:hypothetical protein
MTSHNRRWMLLLPAIALVIVFLLGCQAPDRGDAAFPGSLVLSTPHTRSASPTPAFPPFTVGAWPSNSAPGTSDHIIIYVICRIQNAAASMASTPAAGVQVQVHLSYPMNQSYVGTTQQDGIARVVVAFSGARAGLPVLVDAVTTWQGATYQGQTSFTPAPYNPPSHPSDGGSSHSGHRHKPQPTPPPLATPPVGITPTPMATPLPTTAP